VSVYLSVQRFRVSGVEVRQREQLIIPSGESTTKAAAMRSEDDELGSRPDVSRSRLERFFLFLKIDLWCQLI
jgi:hypothetical protein